MLLTKVNGAWKDTTAAWVKVNGIWKEIVDIKVKGNGSWDLVYQALPPDPAVLYISGTKQVGVTGYDPKYTYEVWRTGGSKLGVVDGAGKYTVPSYDVSYEVHMKATPNSSKYHNTTFTFKAERWTADTRHEVCDVRGECGPGPDCSCHPGYGPSCTIGCCNGNCNCCIHLNCKKCWIEGSAPTLINEPGYTHKYNCWFKSPA